MVCIAWFFFHIFMINFVCATFKYFIITPTTTTTTTTPLTSAWSTERNYLKLFICSTFYGWINHPAIVSLFKPHGGFLFFVSKSISSQSKLNHRIDWKILWPINSLVISSEVLLGQIFKETGNLDGIELSESAARPLLLFWRISAALPPLRRPHRCSLPRLSSAQSAAGAGAAWTRFFFSSPA